MAKILIVKLGSTFSSLAKVRGDFEDWVIERSGFEKAYFSVHNALILNKFPDVNDFNGVILTGSHEMVTDNHNWSRSTEHWLREKVHGKVPILGICYGHQLLANAFNGTVDYDNGGMEIGTVSLSLMDAAKSDFLFREFKEPFPVIMSHSQSVLKLPVGAIKLAATEQCKNAAFFLSPFTWGIQFHPEFDEEIVRYYIERAKRKLIEEGKDPEQIFHSVKNSPQSIKILHKFCDFCLSR